MRCQICLSASDPTAVVVSVFMNSRETVYLIESVHVDFHHSNVNMAIVFIRRIYAKKI